MQRAGGRGGTWGSAEGQDAATGGSRSSSEMLAQPGEEVSTQPARNYCLPWHGQEEKYDGKQGDENNAGENRMLESW